MNEVGGVNWDLSLLAVRTFRNPPQLLKKGSFPVVCVLVAEAVLPSLSPGFPDYLINHLQWKFIWRRMCHCSDMEPQLFSHIRHFYTVSQKVGRKLEARKNQSCMQLWKPCSEDDYSVRGPPGEEERNGRREEGLLPQATLTTCILCESDLHLSKAPRIQKRSDEASGNC